MMRSFLWILVFALIGCSDRKLLDETIVMSDAKREEVKEVNVNELINRARWGDGAAFLKLADCYRDGKGVKQDFLGMVGMVAQAEELGVLTSVGDYIRNIPQDNVYQRLFSILDVSESSILEKQDSIEELCSAIDIPEAYVVRGMIALEAKDSVRAFDMFKIAEEQGSMFALVATGAYDLMYKKELDTAKFETIAINSPIAYMFLAKSCRARGNDRKSAEYLLKAEEKAMLTKGAAMWLLDYCKKDSTIRLSEEDRKRIGSFAGVRQNSLVTDSISADSIN